MVGTARRNRGKLLAFSVAALIAVIGITVLVRSHAATAVVSAEAENGTASTGATVVTDSAASGQKAISFSQPATSTAHDYVQDFNTALTSWPSTGTAPAGYTGWCAYADGTVGSHGAQNVYWPSKTVTVHDGYMDIWDHNSQGAALLPFCYVGFLYGTFSVQMRVTAAGGDAGGGYAAYHNAFMLWPNSGNGTGAAAGQFDYPESDTTVTNPFMAIEQTDGTFLPANTVKRTAQPWTDGKWHTYTTQWGPGFVSCYQDGVLIAKVTSGVPTWKMHPVLQNEWYTLPDPAISGHTEVTRVTYDASYTIAPANF